MWQDDKGIWGQETLLICIALCPFLSLVPAPLPFTVLVGLGWWLRDQGCLLHSPCLVLHWAGGCEIRAALCTVLMNFFIPSLKQARGKDFTVLLDTSVGTVEIQLVFPGLVVPNPLPPSQHQVGDRVGLGCLCMEADACSPMSQWCEERWGTRRSSF